MSEKDSVFWQSPGGYERLAKSYERNISIRNPSGVDCWCGANCPWAAHRVKYIEYRGERLV